ncbi:hypothetical protein D3C77_430560 [compost metagenome]
MHGAAGRVQQLEGAWVTQLGGGLWCFVRLHQQVLAAIAQAGDPARGVEPETPEGVVYQELDHVARREELVAYRQFAAVARRLRRIAHRLALFFGIEVLVDPADGFVFAPQRGDVGIVDQVEHLQQRRLTREQTPLRRVAVEQARQVLAEFIEHAEQVHAIGIAGFT